MNNQDFTKCFSCKNRNEYGYCKATYCQYIPIESETTNKIEQINLIVPCPISNQIKALEVEDE